MVIPISGDMPAPMPIRPKRSTASADEAVRFEELLIDQVEPADEDGHSNFNGKWQDMSRGPSNSKGTRLTDDFIQENSQGGEKDKDAQMRGRRIDLRA